MNFKNISLNIFIVFFSLLILEIFSSFTVYFLENKSGTLFKFLHVKKKQIEYKLNWDINRNKIIPGVYKHRYENKEVTFTINSKGFRGKEFSLKKKNQYRVITFGGSTTMGLETEDQGTYPAQLEKILKNNNYDVEVINFGMSSKSLNYIKKILFTEAIKYKPDIITINSNRNSTMYDSVGTRIDLSKSYEKNINFLKINFYLMENIMTYRLSMKIVNKFKSMKIKTDKIVSPYNKKIEHNEYYFTNQYLDTLEEIIEFAKVNSIKVVLIKQPIFIDLAIQKKLRQKSNKELLIILKKERKNKFTKLDYHDAFWIITNIILNNNLSKFENHENVTIIETENEMFKNKKNFVDFLHLSSEGNKILAEQIFTKLKTLVN